jgi:hypothetical protein
LGRIGFLAGEAVGVPVDNAKRHGVIAHLPLAVGGFLDADWLAHRARNRR